MVKEKRYKRLIVSPSAPAPAPKRVGFIVDDDNASAGSSVSRGSGRRGVMFANDVKGGEEGEEHEEVSEETRMCCMFIR